MNKFVSSMLGAFTGTWIAFLLSGILVMFFGVMMIVSMSAGGGMVANIDDNSVLCIDLSGNITDRPYNKTLQDLLNGDVETGDNIHNILKALKEAEENEKIKGVFITCSGSSMGPATARTLRNAIKDFKKNSKKWVLAYGHEITQADYYVASVADEIYLNPVGALDIHGLTSAKMFYTGLLQKLGVEMQIFRVGTFKSAVEPYFRTDMSEANRLQTQAYIDNIWKQMVDDIAESRSVKANIITEYADSLYAFSDAKIAKDMKLVTDLCYQHQVEEKIQKRLGVEKRDDINFVTTMTAANAGNDSMNSDNQIAVLYAEGDIVESGIDGEICSNDLVPQIIALAEEDEVKGLVLRVNSPGGSAFASEQIWEAIEYFKGKKKPVAVSMGDFAASGGYYISSGADCIFAEPPTITGSIGIFGIVPCMQKLFNDHLGLTTDYATTTPNANIDIYHPLTQKQCDAFQSSVNRGYETFTKRCANGRHISQDSIKSIAEGRVWDGISAKRIGLVDELGSLNEAIVWVAKKAKVDTDYDVSYYPEYTPNFVDVMLNSSFDTAALRLDLGKPAIIDAQAEELKKILRRDRLQCRMEYVVIL